VIATVTVDAPPVAATSQAPEIWVTPGFDVTFALVTVLFAGEVTVGAGATVSTRTFELDAVPVFPATSLWDAVNEYNPFTVRFTGNVHEPDEQVAVWFDRVAAPVTLIVTFPSPLVHPPVIDVIPGAPTTTPDAGDVTVTTGAVTSTVNVFVDDTPVLVGVAQSDWVATAV